MFLHDQFVFDATNKWPGEEWEHGYEAAFTQFVCETLEISTELEARALGTLVGGPLPRSARSLPVHIGSCLRPLSRASVWRESAPFAGFALFPIS